MSSISSGTTTTTGYVVSSDTTGALVLKTGASDTTAVTIDTSQNVGIGTSSPVPYGGFKSLTLNGSTGGLIQLQSNGTSTGRFYAPSTTNTVIDTLAGNLTVYANGSLFLGTGNATKVTLDTSGNLGLGVTPSAWASPVGTAIEFPNGTTFAAYTSGGLPSAYLTSNGYYNGSNWVYKVSKPAVQYQLNGNSGIHQWFTAPSGTAGNAISFTQAMTLDASGNLGVGTTSPLRKLTSGGTTGELVLLGTGADGVEDALIGRISSQTRTSGSASTSSFASIEFRTGGFPWYGSSIIRFLTTVGGDGTTGAGTERARINSGGYFKASNTGSYANATGTYHELVNSDTRCFQFRSTATTGELSNYIEFTGQAPNNTASAFLYCTDTSATRFGFRSNGGLANYSANNVNLSDRREKTNFAPATSYLDKICAIPVQTFNYIDQNMEDDGGLTLGVVAQDVQAVAPELVLESNWAGKDEAPKMRLSIYQTDLQYALMKCIQEQQVLIQQLQADVAILKGVQQ